MSHISYGLLMEQDHDTATMKAFHGPGNIKLGNRAYPESPSG
jgi:hypothetical protein